MKNNRLTICILKPVEKVFGFVITPPNSTKWIEAVVSEETNELPVRTGIVYTLRDKNNEISEYTITAFEENKLVEWTSKDHNYHVRYTFRPVDENATDFTYYEWVEVGNISSPFTMETLEKLKEEIEVSP